MNPRRKLCRLAWLLPLMVLGPSCRPASCCRRRRPGGVLDGVSVLGNRVLVNTLTTNKLFSVPIERGGRAGTVVEVKLDRAIAGPDGMRNLGENSLLLAESGGGRVSRVDLSGDTGKVTTLQKGFPSGPVSATVIGSELYVVDAQFAALRSNSFKPFEVQGFVLTGQ
jgi:hypothetical protein